MTREASMARFMPSHPIIPVENAIFTSLFHGVLTLSIIYTSVALVFFLCAPRSRKKTSSTSPSSSPRPSTSSPSQPQASSVSPPMMPPGGEEMTTAAAATATEHGPLPPPPPMNLYRNYSVQHDSGTKKLMVSLSQKLTRSWTKREGGGSLVGDGLVTGLGHKVRGKSMSTTFNEGDLIWKKQIILGERCKVPHRDHNDEEEAVVDDQGNKVNAYRPRTPRSLPVSRTTSAIDTSAIDGSAANDDIASINS